MKNKNKMNTSLSMIVATILLTACGGGGGGTNASSATQSKTGYFIDAAVQDLDYNSTSGLKGTTDAKGRFSYKEGDEVSFHIGNLILGSGKPESTGLIKPAILTKNNAANTTLLLRTLQSLDDDGNTSNGIKISSATKADLEKISPKRFESLGENELINLSTEIKHRLDRNDDGVIDVSATEANNHQAESLQEFENEHQNTTTNNSGENEGSGSHNDEGTNSNTSGENEGSNSHNDEGTNSNTSGENESSDNHNDEGSSTHDSGENEGSENHDGENHSGGGTTTGGGTTNPPTSTNKTYMITAWNDLGMHCMDGNDFSVFSVLPPYNNLHAQLKNKNGGLITSGVTVTYQSIQGTDGKINTSSTDKTNFWDYSKKLFGVTLASNTGLKGNKTPSTTPQAMQFNTTHQWWEAEGIPLTPYNDDGSKNYYPMVRVTAKDSTGKVLSSVDTVLPVSDEMDCKRCHASNSAPAGQPTQGWVNNADPEKDFKLNILRLHDERMPNAVRNNLTALQAKGYNYNTAGLEATVASGTPILCATCHASNALPGTGITGVKAFTQAIHAYHAKVTDPNTNLSLNSSQNRGACYSCHPGAATKCLRGAMGDATDGAGNNVMQCQSCHGNMSQVGAASRHGWLDEPNCQACHHDGVQETSAIDPTTNTLRNAVDTRFATNPNVPAQGFNLYRFSTGHGNLQCEACHGATHAIYPAHNADNIASTSIQGHTGTIAECTACHTTVPNTVTGGPHGMHPVGQSWVRGHEHVAENNPAQCKACHGSNYRGSTLSKTWTNRSFSTEWGQKNFTKGHKVSCYDCHNGPNG